MHATGNCQGALVHTHMQPSSCIWAVPYVKFNHYIPCGTDNHINHELLYAYDLPKLRLRFIEYFLHAMISTVLTKIINLWAGMRKSSLCTKTHMFILWHLPPHCFTKNHNYSCNWLSFGMESHIHVLQIFLKFFLLNLCT